MSFYLRNRALQNCKGSSLHTQFSPRTLHEKFFLATKEGNVLFLQRLLAENCVNINHIGHGGKSALFHAISQQHIPAVKTLLKHGVSVDVSCFTSYHRDHAGMQLMSSDEPPIVTAARVDNAEIVKLLLTAGANPDDQALCHTNLSGVSIKDRTALHFACENVNVAMVRYLLLHHADVNIEDKQNESAIHLAVRCRRCPSQGEIVTLLCEHGSDVNSLNKIECPPLYLASFYGCVNKVETLLLYGANVNNLCVRDSSYGTALHIAAMKDRYALTEKLIVHGAQLSLRNGLQYTPLHLNINSHSKSDIAPLLIYHGVDAKGTDKFNFTILASIIRNMRFDCEILAKLLVYSGYDLRQDIWLIPPENVWRKEESDMCRQEDVNVSEQDNSSAILPIEVPHVPIPAGRVAELCEWLRKNQSNPLKLCQLCRIEIRRALSQAVAGRSIVQNISLLPLPTAIKDYITLKDFYTVENKTSS